MNSKTWKRLEESWVLWMETGEEDFIVQMIRLVPSPDSSLILFFHCSNLVRFPQLPPRNLLDAFGHIIEELAPQYPVAECLHVCNTGDWQLLRDYLNEHQNPYASVLFGSYLTAQEWSQLGWTSLGKNRVGVLAGYCDCHGLPKDFHSLTHNIQRSIATAWVDAVTKKDSVLLESLLVLANIFDDGLMGSNPNPTFWFVREQKHENSYLLNLTCHLLILSNNDPECVRVILNFLYHPELLSAHRGLILARCYHGSIEMRELFLEYFFSGREMILEEYGSACHQSLDVEDAVFLGKRENNFYRGYYIYPVGDQDVKRKNCELLQARVDETMLLLNIADENRIVSPIITKLHRSIDFNNYA